MYFGGYKKVKSQSQDKISRKLFHEAEIFLLVVVFLFGITVCFILPVGAGYDEETHLMRVWEMSTYTFIPNDALGAKMPYPAVYWEMSYRRQSIVKVVDRDFWENYGKLALDDHDYIYGNLKTRSVYSPLLLLPQALVMRFLGAKLQFSALTVFYACRLVGLFTYLLLTWLAVRFIPIGKWMLAILAASPVAILQASTVSADTLSNGIAFLFISCAMAISMRNELKWKEWNILALLFMLLFWGKVNIVPLALLPFLLIKPSQFKYKYGYLALLAAALILCLVEVLGWNVIAYSRLHTAPEGTDPIGQVNFILAHPLGFSGILLKDISENIVSYMRGWIAIYGYDYWPVPTAVFYVYIAGLFIALPTKESVELKKQARMGLVIVFALMFLATIALLYLSFNPVGSLTIQGVQGRYFTPVMPLFFLALAGLPFWKNIKVPTSLGGIFIVTSLIVFTAGMYLSYYVTCGSQFYEVGNCYQPKYKNWAPNNLYSPPISGQFSLAQEIVPECNGMTELRVWVSSATTKPDTVTSFIFRDTKQDLEAVNIKASNSNLPKGGWYTLNFPPDWESKGKLYLLTIAEDGINESGLRIAYSLKPEYLTGKLYENGQQIENDLIFQTGCVAGLKKIFR